MHAAAGEGLKTPLNLLVVDDDDGVLASARYLFEGEGWKVHTARAPEEAVRRVQRHEYDAALVDMNYARNTTSGMEGLDLLARLTTEDPDLPVLLMTAWGTIDLAVEAMQHGARDFVQKPWDNSRVLAQVSKHGQLGRALRAGRLLAQENRLLRADSSLPGFIANSAAMKPILEVLHHVAPSEASVLILGENGTGKGVVARLIHEQSARAGGPFINVNMGGLPESLFESELFGHVKGAFTDAKADRPGRFELARGGTIFLDEIGNVSLTQQAKLLRLIETGEFERVGSSRTIKADVRLVSATNSVLRDEVASGEFREDLFYRLNTVTIELPPLRERREDLLPLAQFFLARHRAKYRRDIGGFSAEAQEHLLHHSWPGNVRELDHALERAVLMCHDRLIAPRHLALAPAQGTPADLESMSLEDVEKILIRKALQRHQGNVTETARQLGVSRATLYRRLQALGI